MRLLIVPVLGLALSLGGCDKHSAPTPQPKVEEVEPAAGDATSEAEGTVDRTHKGEAMPDKQFEMPNGTQTTLASFKGKPLLLNLWATWCGPCVAEMPTLDALAGKEAARLQVVVISQDMQGKKIVGPWWEKKGFRALKPYLDPKADLSFAYGGGALPATILFDKDGKEVWRVLGPMDWSGERAAKLIAEGLGAGA